MDGEHFILVSLDDPKSKLIADVFASKTCKKIIFYLTETKEASEKDLSDSLKIPMNTVEYNLKKLVESGFVQKKKNFFWSKKGKKIAMYELTNKSIVLSPKKATSEKIKSILPAFILTFAGTVSIWVYERINSINLTRTPSILNQASNFIAKEAADSSSLIAGAGRTIASPLSLNQFLWLYFLAGAIITTTIITIINWKKL